MEQYVGTIIIQSVIFAIGLFKLYTDMQMKLRELEVRLTQVEHRDDEIYDSLEKIKEQLTAIKVQLEQKVNRIP